VKTGLDLQIGDLDRRATILRPTFTKDAAGEQIPGDPAPTTRWAAVLPSMGSERFLNAETAAEARLDFFFRWEAGLVEVTDSIQHEDGRIYAVIAPPEEHGGRRNFMRVRTAARGEQLQEGDG
jgi:head-tail adaptor